MACACDEETEKDTERNHTVANWVKGIFPDHPRRRIEIKFGMEVHVVGGGAF